MKTKKNKDLALNTRIENDQLVITVGISVLAFASKEKNGGPLDDKKFKIINENHWAKDVLRALNHESETGETLVTKMLDGAYEEAINDGAEGVEYKKVKITHEKC